MKGCEIVLYGTSEQTAALTCNEHGVLEWDVSTPDEVARLTSEHLDSICESCGRRGREMVTATVNGMTFHVCEFCGQDARDHGAEVAS